MIIYNERTQRKYDISMHELIDGKWIDVEDTIIDSSFHWDYERDCWSTDSGDIVDYLDDWIHYATDFDRSYLGTVAEMEEMQKRQPRSYSLSVIK